MQEASSGNNGQVNECSCQQHKAALCMTAHNTLYTHVILPDNAWALWKSEVARQALVICISIGASCGPEAS